MRRLTNPQQSLLSRLWTIMVGIVIGGGGFLIAFYTFVFPLVTVVASDAPLNPSDVFTTPFTVSHIGYIPIRNVRFICYQNEIREVENRIEIKGQTQRIITENPINLGVGQSTTVGCPLGVKGVTVSSADIAIIVCYYPWRIPVQRHQIQRFMTVKKADGTLRWYPVEFATDFNQELAISKCNS